MSQTNEQDAGGSGADPAEPSLTVTGPYGSTTLGEGGLPEPVATPAGGEAADAAQADRQEGTESAS